ncbi:hypothetical protein DFH09DRAFT_1200106 [Mycena vulgaris]|nr:hypothetical protein DFH09DRAFT_1200106 [Mycena vulgaris]
MCPLHSYLILAVVGPSLPYSIFPLYIPFGPRHLPLLVITYSALLIHSGFTSWSRIRIAV